MTKHTDYENGIRMGWRLAFAYLNMTPPAEDITEALAQPIEPDPVPLSDRDPDVMKPPPQRPWLLTYSGVRVDLDDYLYGLYLRAGEDATARSLLYEKAGTGGWDDVCRDCSLVRYEHVGLGVDHPFISEEQ